jgi:hypothetical protein
MYTLETSLFGFLPKPLLAHCFGFLHHTIIFNLVILDTSLFGFLPKPLLAHCFNFLHNMFLSNRSTVHTGKNYFMTYQTYFGPLHSIPGSATAPPAAPEGLTWYPAASLLQLGDTPRVVVRIFIKFEDAI